MSSLVPLVYYGGMFVLFFFWIYGIASFVLDVKNKVVPGIRRYRRGRKKLAEKRRREREHEEKEEQLY
ncbi:hypothetical protein ACFOZ7_01745 [Natribaculum luteum]|uniref:Uncharacterized protein n=1 Tax=Natribaculum luteum TaxID=1586232 RepID=A0ABD5NVH8_9EURY|nr:hypothetical protein [Natribaculum luteum]